MKKTTKLTTVIATALAAALALAGCAAASDAPANTLGTITGGTLRVGTLTDTKPYAYVENGVTKGFDVEMLEEVAKRLDLKVEFVTQEFSALLPSVSNGLLDIATASISNTEERRKIVDFSDTYFIGYISVIASKTGGVTEDPASLKGKRLGLIQGTIQDGYAQANFGADIVRFPDNNAAIAALKSGTIDAHFLDYPVAQDYADKDANLSIPISVAVPEYPVGFAISKKNKALTKAVNDQIKALIDDGTWLKIETKYFPEQPVDDMFKPEA